jgi:hypothetical protein
MLPADLNFFVPKEARHVFPGNEVFAADQLYVQQPGELVADGRDDLARLV